MYPDRRHKKAHHHRFLRLGRETLVSDLTLAQAKKKGAKALREAKVLIREGKMTPRTAYREVLDVYWGLYRQLGHKARVEFDAWFRAEHEIAGKEIEGK